MKKFLLIGLALIAMTIPWDGQGADLGFISLTPSNFLLLITLFGFCLWIYMRKKIPRIPPWLVFAWGMYIFTSIWKIGMLSSPEPRILFTLIGAFLLYISLVTLIRNENDLKYITIGYGIGACIQVAFALVQIFGFYYLGVSWRILQYTPTGGDTLLVRAMGTQFDPNFYGIYLLPILGIAGAMIFEAASRRARLGSLLLFLFMLAGVFVSFSRTAMIMSIFIVLVLFFSFLSRRIRIPSNIIKVTMVSAFISVFFALAFLPILPVEGLGFVGRLIQLNAPSVYARYVTFEEALNEWSKAPLFGHGFTKVTARLADYYTHNIFLLIMLRSGLVGLISFIFIFGFAFFIATKRLLKCQNFSWFTRAMIKGYVVGLYAMILTFLSFGFEGHKMIWLVCGITTAIGLNLKNTKMSYEQNKNSFSI